MGYVDKNLISGETVAYRARLHWILFVKPLLIAIVVVGVVAGIFYAADLFNSLSGQTAALIWVGVLVFAALPLPSSTSAISPSNSEAISSAHSCKIWRSVRVK